MAGTFLGAVLLPPTVPCHAPHNSLSLDSTGGPPDMHILDALPSEEVGVFGQGCVCGACLGGRLGLRYMHSCILDELAGV